MTGDSTRLDDCRVRGDPRGARVPAGLCDRRAVVGGIRTGSIPRNPSGSSTASARSGLPLRPRASACSVRCCSARLFARGFEGLATAHRGRWSCRGCGRSTARSARCSALHRARGRLDRGGARGPGLGPGSLRADIQRSASCAGSTSVLPPSGAASQRARAPRRPAVDPGPERRRPGARRGRAEDRRRARRRGQRGAGRR